MFFVLSKVFYFLLQPFIWMLILFVLFFIVKSTKKKRRIKITLITVLLFFSNTAILKSFLHLWEIPAKKIENVAQYNVGVVLGGMFEWDNDIKGLSVRRGADRIWQTIQLYKNNKIKKILISGDSGYVTDRGLNEAKQLKEVLITIGIPSIDIIIEDKSRNTHENAEFTTRLLKQSYPHLENVLLITSARHMRRAHACFLKEGLECAIFSTDQFTGSSLSFNWDEFIVPSASTVDGWTDFIKEIIGYLVYDVVGYI